METKDIFILILGWLFGILSPGITSHISNRYKKKSLEQILIAELQDIKTRLANIPILVYPKYNMLDERTFSWIREQTNNFKTLTYKTNGNEDIKLKIDSLNDPEFVKNLISEFNETENPDVGIGFKKFSMSVVDSNIVNISLLDESFLVKVLDIKFHINSLNETIQLINDYTRLTFDGNISQANHAIIIAEINRHNIIVAKNAILIVDKINKAIQ